MTEYKLTDDEYSMLTGIVESAELQIRTLVNLIAKQQGFKGRFALSADRTKITSVEIKNGQE